MMFLYQVKDELDQALTIAQTHEVIPGYEFLFNKDGEVDYDLLDCYIEKLYEDRDAIIEDTARLVQNLQAEADAIKREEERLNARRKAVEGRVAFLSDRLTTTLNGTNWTSLASALKIMFRSSEALMVDDESAIDPEYFNIKTVKQLDKVKAKKAIKEGAVLAGCHIEKRKNISIK